LTLKQNKLKSVLFIGDSYQLPPVDEGEHRIIKLPKQFKLTKIVRQAKDSYTDIKYTFASTIHKFQGSSYKSIKRHKSIILILYLFPLKISYIFFIFIKVNPN